MADGTISIDIELNEAAFKASLENMGGIVKSGAAQMIKSVNNLSGSFVLLPDTVTSVCNSVPDIINGVINSIAGQNPVMAKTGADFFTSLISNISGIIENITGAVPEITEKAAEKIAEGGSLISDAGFNLFCSLTNPLPEAIKEIIKAPDEIISILAEKFHSLTGQFKSVGENIVYGVWSGISAMASWLANQVKGFFSGIVGAATSFLGISSPSKLFRDLVGKNIALGVKSGIDNEMPGVIIDTRAQMSRLADAAAQSAVINPGAADIIGRSNITDASELHGMLKNRFENESSGSSAALPEINVTLEPSGDIRGFFDYISMGIKRADYLNGNINGGK